MCVVLLLCASMCGSISAQDQFVAIPPEQAAQYHFDFARHFFASPEAEKADRAALYASLKELEGLKGQITTSADNLLRALELNDAAQVKFARHYIYLYLRGAVNTQDEASISDGSALNAEVNARTAFIQQELMGLDERTLAAFVARQPALNKYLFAVESSRRRRPHTLTLKEEEMLGSTAPLNAEWQYELYLKLIARATSASAQTLAGALDAAKPGAVVANNPERAAREANFKMRYAGFASERDLYAFTLLRLAQAGNQLARLRHFEDAADKAYFDRYWSKAEVNGVLEQVAGQADLYKRYQRLRADYVGKLLGETDVKLWDMSVRPPGFKPPRFTIAEASRNIRDALAPLGSEYARELAALLDPANGRMDIVPGANRKSGGFSQGFVGTDSVFYAVGFAGSYNDMRVLAHESTHAVQRQLMTRGGVLPVYSASPSYFAESFAIFNELLLPDYLYRRETDPLRKRFFLEQFLEGKGTVMFVAAPEALLEQAVYDGVARGTVRGADDLDALTKTIYSRFSIWTDKHEELKNQWMLVPLMYEDPFYDINYVYGALLALKYYELYARDPAHFMPRYIALLSHGFDAPPAALLKRFLDIDLNDPHLVADACRIVKEKVDLLEESYRQ